MSPASCWEAQTVSPMCFPSPSSTGIRKRARPRLGVDVGNLSTIGLENHNVRFGWICPGVERLHFLDHQLRSVGGNVRARISDRSGGLPSPCPSTSLRMSISTLWGLARSLANADFNRRHVENLPLDKVGIGTRGNRGQSDKPNNANDDIQPDFGYASHGKNSHPQLIRNFPDETPPTKVAGSFVDRTEAFQQTTASVQCISGQSTINPCGQVAVKACTMACVMPNATSFPGRKIPLFAAAVLAHGDRNVLRPAAGAVGCAQ